MAAQSAARSSKRPSPKLQRSSNHQASNAIRMRSLESKVGLRAQWRIRGIPRLISISFMSIWSTAQESTILQSREHARVKRLALLSGVQFDQAASNPVKPRQANCQAGSDLIKASPSASGSAGRFSPKSKVRSPRSGARVEGIRFRGWSCRPKSPLVKPSPGSPGCLSDRVQVDPTRSD